MEGINPSTRPNSLGGLTVTVDPETSTVWHHRETSLPKASLVLSLFFSAVDSDHPFSANSAFSAPGVTVH